MKGENRFRQNFHREPVILPVIHAESYTQSYKNAQIAWDAGADGIFLINHGISCRALLTIFKELHRSYPDWWIGVNILGVHPMDIFPILPGDVSGLWTDNACIQEDSENQEEASRILEVRRISGWNGLYFGGVAFKYQRLVNDVGTAARIACRYMDVITTSGPGTGTAADPQKIKIMKDAIGYHPLAIASGITPENIGAYLPYADCFLVSTGVSKNFYFFDPTRMKSLIDGVRSRENPVTKQN